MAETFLSHLVAGLFVLAFGAAFLGLTVWRLVRLMATIHHLGGSNDIQNAVVDRRRKFHHRQRRGIETTTRGKEEGQAHNDDDDNDDDDSATPTDDYSTTPINASELLLREFLHRHVPEQSPRVLRTTSYAIAGSCLFGMVYTMIGGRFLNHDLNSDYTVFHYVTHLTLLLLYLFVGWTGLLEANGFLPKDSLRVATALALWGETLLWTQHGASKDNDLDAALHYSLGGITGLTAVCLTASVLLVAGRSHHHPNPPTTISFLLYVAAFVGLVWQGLWFLTIAVYVKGWLPIPSAGHATALLVVEGLFLVVLCQLMAAGLVSSWHKQTPVFAGRGGGQHNHHESAPIL